VASCTPLTHQPLFQDSIRMAGLNPYLFEMANIRNQCSWVHSNDKEAATAKARDLIRAAAARAALLEAQHTIEVPVQRAALVIGGGAAGMTAAHLLAEQGFPVHLVEKENELGGNLRNVFIGSNNADPQATLLRLTDQVRTHPSVHLHLQSKVISTTGVMGNFTSVIEAADGNRTEISHAVTILATGAQEYRGTEYGYGTDARIVTQQEFEGILSKQVDMYTSKQQENNDVSTCLPVSLSTVVMIQCVGPAEKFCARICCTVALKNALRLKELRPDAQVVILYRDIRSYGFKEKLYTQARQKGVIFVRYEPDRKPEVLADEKLKVKVWDPSLHRELELNPDLLVLSMPAVPRVDARDLAMMFKVPSDADGFFLEAHVKLRPVDFATNGIFMAGMAHYPKLLDETMIQAQAAAARAARVLSRPTLSAGGSVAVVDAARCTGCLTCVRICPFGVPKMRLDLTGVGGITGAAYIEAAICQGCGSCAAECPARAIQLMHYTDVQMTAKVGALLQLPVLQGAGI